MPEESNEDYHTTYGHETDANSWNESPQQRMAEESAQHSGNTSEINNVLASAFSAPVIPDLILPESGNFDLDRYVAPAYYGEPRNVPFHQPMYDGQEWVGCSTEQPVSFPSGESELMAQRAATYGATFDNEPGLLFDTRLANVLHDQPRTWNDGVAEMTNQMSMDVGDPWTPWNAFHTVRQDWDSSRFPHSTDTSQPVSSNSANCPEVYSVSPGTTTWPQSNTSERLFSPIMIDGMMPPQQSLPFRTRDSSPSVTQTFHSYTPGSWHAESRGTHTVGREYNSGGHVDSGPTNHRRAHERNLGPDDARLPDIRFSPDPSVSSETPPHLPDVLLCEHGGCPKTFTGKYRRGTLQRHMRLKHQNGQHAAEKQYACEACGCYKVFKRQDARLKHYRNKHAELHVANPVLRRRRQL